MLSPLSLSVVSKLRDDSTVSSLVSAQVWDDIDTWRDRRGVEADIDPLGPVQVCWMLCRAVWATDRSPAFAESAGRLAGWPGPLDRVMSRLVRRHTLPTLSAVAAVAVELEVSLGRVATTAAHLADATCTEIAEFCGVTDDVVRSWMLEPGDDILA